MDILWYAIGIAMIMIAAWDVFRELVQPVGRGVISSLITGSLWTHLHPRVRRHKRLAMLLGPSLMLSVIAIWIILIVIGFAFITWAAMPNYFIETTTGHHPHSFSEALYVSLVTVSTLGYGDIVPVHSLFRLIIPLEAMFGLGLVSATIAWLLSLPPILSHRASLAAKISLIEHTEQQAGERISDLPQAERIFTDLVNQLVTVHADLLRFPMSYYFLPHETERSLPHNLLFAWNFANYSNTQDKDLKFAKIMLCEELARLAHLLDTQFLHIDADTSTVLTAYANDHPHFTDR